MRAIPIKTIVTHEMPHLDEYTAYFQLIEFGKKLFPGVETAEIVYVPAGSEPWEGKTADEWLKEGVLALGVWFGMFDEHSNQKTGKPPNKKACTATLVADYLGTSNRAALRQLLTFTLRTDKKTGADPFDLSSLVKALHKDNPNDPVGVLDLVMKIIKAKYKEALNFVQAKKEYRGKVGVGSAKVEEINILDRAGSLKVCTISSDNIEMPTAARLQGNDVVIIRKSTGHMLIFSNHETVSVHDFRKVAAEIRRQERQKGGYLKELSFNVLEASGVTEGAPQWYLDEPGRSLFNSSLRNTDIPVTKLSMQEIVQAVRTGLGQKKKSVSQKLHRKPVQGKKAPQSQIKGANKDTKESSVPQKKFVKKQKGEEPSPLASHEMIQNLVNNFPERKVVTT